MEDDLLREQAEFLRHGGRPSARAIRIGPRPVPPAHTSPPAPPVPTETPSSRPDVPPPLAKPTPNSVLGAIVERNPPAPAALPVLLPSTTSTSFPVAAHRGTATRFGSRFSQQRRAVAGGVGSSTGAGAGAGMDGPPEYPIPSGIPTGDLLQDIAAENQAKIASMSVAEIRAYQEEIHARLPPDLVRALKNRGQPPPGRAAPRPPTSAPPLPVRATPPTTPTALTTPTYPPTAPTALPLPDVARVCFDAHGHPTGTLPPEATVYPHLYASLVQEGATGSGLAIQLSALRDLSRPPLAVVMGTAAAAALDDAPPHPHQVHTLGHPGVDLDMGLGPGRGLDRTGDGGVEGGAGGRPLPEWLALLRSGHAAQRALACQALERILTRARTSWCAHDDVVVSSDDDCLEASKRRVTVTWGQVWEYVAGHRARLEMLRRTLDVSHTATCAAAIRCLAAVAGAREDVELRAWDLFWSAPPAIRLLLPQATLERSSAAHRWRPAHNNQEKKENHEDQDISSTTDQDYVPDPLAFLSQTSLWPRLRYALHEMRIGGVARLSALRLLVAAALSGERGTQAVLRPDPAGLLTLLSEIWNPPMDSTLTLTVRRVRVGVIQYQA